MWLARAERTSIYKIYFDKKYLTQRNTKAMSLFRLMSPSRPLHQIDTEQAVIMVRECEQTCLVKHKKSIDLNSVLII